MGETRVDLLHLLEDLADAYPGDVQETLLTEIVANALDSGASIVALATDASAATLTVIDDGVGMRRADLRRFHDVAASVKTRGEGIGFAGVGIKLGLLVSDAVVTESRRGKDHIATTWALTTRKRAPWQWIQPPGLVAERGTAVRLRLSNPLSPLLDPALLETMLRRHFAPLFDSRFDDVLSEHYPSGVRFMINASLIDRRDVRGDSPDSAPVSVRLARKRKPSAFGYVERASYPLADELQGIAVSTLGKVIKRGWDWLGLAPVTAARVSGLVEVPALASCLTLNKADFLRAGPRGATYLAYRKALQEAISTQLAEWGDTPASENAPRRRAARPVERDVEEILAELANRFPMLASLVERRAGGRKKLLPAIGGNGTDASGAIDMFAEAKPGASQETPAASETSEDADARRPVEQSPSPAGELPAPARKGAKRAARLGLTIQFESRPDEGELGRLAESTVWINEAHPAFRRAAASRSENYHIAVSVAMALASLAVEPAQEHGFVTEFLARWGESVGGRKPRRKKNATSRR